MNKKREFEGIIKLLLLETVTLQQFTKVSIET